MINEQIVGFEYFQNTNSVTVHKLLADGSLHSMGFICNMIDEMKQYIEDVNHPLITFCQTIWTQEVIDAYTTMILDQEVL